METTETTEEKQKPASVHIATSYCFNNMTQVELPEGKKPEDIESVYVKWCTVFILFKDGTEFQKEESDFDLSSDGGYKRPMSFEVLNDNAEGFPDFDQILFEES
jgi:hypothetical protein